AADVSQCVHRERRFKTLGAASFHAAMTSRRYCGAGRVGSPDLAQLGLLGRCSKSSAMWGYTGRASDVVARAALGGGEMLRGFFRSDISVSAHFVWRCLSGSTVAPFPHPAHRTGQAALPHPALRRLQLFGYLHSCSGCFRLERSPGGTFTHWKAPPFHGAHPKVTWACGV